MRTIPEGVTARLGYFFRQRCDEASLTQAQLAASLRCNQAVVSRLFSGLAPWTPERVALASYRLAPLLRRYTTEDGKASLATLAYGDMTEPHAALAMDAVGYAVAGFAPTKLDPLPLFEGR